MDSFSTEGRKQKWAQKQIKQRLITNLSVNISERLKVHENASDQTVIGSSFFILWVEK